MPEDGSIDDVAEQPRERRRGLQALGWAVSIICVVGVVWWALRQPAPELPHTAADIWTLVLAVVVYGVCTVLRGERWRILLRDVDARPTRGEALRLTIIGYMGNNVLPARAGDVMRVVLMAPRADTTKRHVVGTLVAERLLDIVVLATLFVVLAITVAGGAGLPSGGKLTLLVAALAVLAAGALVAAYVAHRRGLLARVKEFVGPMVTSTANLRSAHGARMLALTVLIWVGEAVVWGSCAAALNLGASPLEALYLVALASMFALIPSGPGYAGTQDTAAAIGVHAIGGTSQQAVSFIILVRFVLFVPITLAGLVLLATRYGGLKAFRSAEASPPPPPAGGTGATAPA